jgi:formylglycine-generating enzyme required for sulfatase activity
MTIGFLFGVGGLSSLNRGFGDLETGGQDFAGKSPRPSSMNVRPLVGPLGFGKADRRARLWRKAAVHGYVRFWGRSGHATPGAEVAFDPSATLYRCALIAKGRIIFRMIRFGAISAIGSMALQTFVQVVVAEGGTSPGAEPSLPSAPTSHSRLLLEARLPQPLSRNENAALRSMDHFKECEFCPEMLVVPAGQFSMGANENEPGSTPDERPRHEVMFRQSFSVGRFAVTFDEWEACLAAKGCSYRPSDQNWGRGKQPVINILWSDAKEYVKWLSRKTGRPYRLLSEAEREYITRAGTSSAFWWGDNFTPLHANSAHSADYSQPIFGKTVPVDSFIPNPWGFYQVHGNVYDWVDDCGNDSYVNAPSDGAAWMTGNCDVRILRGGAFSRRPETLRSAARLWSAGSNRMIYMSVRVARTGAR